MVIFFEPMDILRIDKPRHLPDQPPVYIPSWYDRWVKKVNPRYSTGVLEKALSKLTPNDRIVVCSSERTIDPSYQWLMKKVGSENIFVPDESVLAEFSEPLDDQIRQNLLVSSGWMRAFKECGQRWPNRKEINGNALGCLNGDCPAFFMEVRFHLPEINPNFILGQDFIL